ncbi:MAG: MlaD family protein [Halorhodospira sp.]
MEPQAQHFWIGLATLLLAIGGLLLGGWLADAPLAGERQALDVVFDEDVSGLSESSPVKLNGITVGRVERLRLDPADPRQVIARISVSPEAPLRADTEAQLGSSGLFTGGAHIQLKAGDPSAPPLEAPPDGVPRLEARPSPLAQLREDSDQLLADVDRLISRSNELLSEANVARLSATLEHLEQVSRVLAERRDDLDRGITALADSGEAAEGTLHEASRLIQRGRALLDGPGHEALASTARASDALAAGGATAEAMLEDNRAAIERGLQGLGEIEPLTAELQRTLATLRRIARRLGEDPGGQLLRREEMETYQP